MRPEVIDYVLAKFEAELTIAVDSLGRELQQMRRRKEELEREIGDLANFVARGSCSPGLRAALVDREREISEITAKLFESRPDSLQTKLRNIRTLVETRMKGNSQRAEFRCCPHPHRVREAHRENHDEAERGTLHSLGNLESDRAWQYRWCRGPGVDRTSAR
jgi:predicted RNase H-like nuclease (RuvC/YqgF family)